MFATTGDILNVVLAVSIGLVAVFLVFLIFYLILTVRDFNYVSRKMRSTADIVNEYVSKPAKAAWALVEKLKLVTHFIEQHQKGKKGKKK